MLLTALLAACDPEAGSDGGPPDDGGGMDAGPDAGFDAGFDAGPFDAAGLEPIGIDLQTIELPDVVELMTDSAFLPDATMLVASHDGTVHHLQIGDDAAVELGSFSIADDDLTVSNDCGLLQLAVDPDWTTNHFLWLGHCGADAESVIRRVEFDGTTYDGVVDTSAEILRVPAPVLSYNHSIGQIGLEEDGTLWTLIGDKGTADGQPTDRLLGVMIRIVPNRDPGGSGYVPATGNAFDGTTSDRPEIFAWGLRYGWRGTRDRLGRYWIGDVGEARFEEVDLITGVGENFGWSTCDGPCDPPSAEMMDPLLYWERTDATHRYFVEDPESEPTNRRVVWVGDAYQPDEFDRYHGFLDDRVPFGDVCLGWVRGAWADESGDVVYDEYWAHQPSITSWRQSPDGWVYVTSFGSCDALDVFDPPTLHRVVPRFF
ncbi:MAG: PQQ-dependent sugar dehydrogenase [Myxococcales bacterium]|nr:PQQ-dependent sugar dehydrogenase [Myxococcales bacterium]